MGSAREDAAKGGGAAGSRGKERKFKRRVVWRVGRLFRFCEKHINGFKSSPVV